MGAQRLEGGVASLNLELQVLVNHLMWVLGWGLNFSPLRAQCVISPPRALIFFSSPLLDVP